MGWGGAIVIVPYRYFKQYGDTSLLENAWEPIQKWIGYLQTRMDDSLITREEPQGWCLGDWVTLEPISLPEPFVNTCLFVRCLDMLMETAPLLGRQEDIPNLAALQHKCRAALEKAYFDPATGHFFGGTQGADAYGIYAGLGDDRTKQLLIGKYDALGHFDTGFIGTDVLLEVLFQLGAADTAYKLLSGEEMGSFLYMKRHGATTIWERWDGLDENGECPIGDDGTDIMISYNHYASGAVGDFLYRRVAGIEALEPGYKTFKVQPILGGDLTWAKGYVLTPYGTVSSHWKIEKGQFTVEVQVPMGTTCQLTMPNGETHTLGNGKHIHTCPV